MFLAGMQDDIDGSLEFVGAFLKPLRLFGRGEGVGAALMDEDGRQGWADVMEGRERAGDVGPGGEIGDGGPEGLGEGFGWAALMEVFGGGSEVHEIGDGIEDGDGLDGAAGPVDGIGGIGWSGAAAGGEHEAEVSTGGSSGDAETVGIDCVGGGVVPDETDPALDILEDLLDGGIGLGDVAHGKDGVAAAEERGAHPGGHFAGFS